MPRATLALIGFTHIAQVYSRCPSGVCWHPCQPSDLWPGHVFSDDCPEEDTTGWWLVLGREEETPEVAAIRLPTCDVAEGLFNFLQGRSPSPPPSIRRIIALCTRLVDEYRTKGEAALQDPAVQIFTWRPEPGECR